MKLWEVTPVAKWSDTNQMAESYVFCETKQDAINEVRKKEGVPSNKRLRAVEVTEPQLIITFYDP